MLTLSIGNILSLGLQSGGAGLAAISEDFSLGAYIAVAGLCLHLGLMAILSALLAELVWRYQRDRPARPFRLRRTRVDRMVEKGAIPDGHIKKVELMIIAIGSSVLLVSARSCYRMAELLGGRDGAYWPSRELSAKACAERSYRPFSFKRNAILRI